MHHLLLISLGGALGTVARYGVNAWLAARPAGASPEAIAFPWATFVTNVTGCFAVGLFETLLAPSPDSGDLRRQWREVLMVGFCGGFTTFSAFGLQAFHLSSGGRHGLASSYVLASCALGIAAAYLGRAAGAALQGRP